MKVGTVQCLEEREGVSSNGVSGTEDEPSRHRRISAGQFLVKLPPAKPGHAKIRDDEVERFFDRPVQRFLSVAGNDGEVTPRFQGGAHVVQDVRLVVDDQDPQLFTGWARERVGRGYR